MSQRTFKVHCLNVGRTLHIDGGDTLLEIATQLGDELTLKPICALVNNKEQDLGFPIYAPKRIEFLDRTHPAGVRVYLHSLCMILYKAVKDCYPDAELVMEYSVSHGYYCLFNGCAIDAEMVERIRARMREIVAADFPFVYHERPTMEVAEIFAKAGLNDKRDLTDPSRHLYTQYYTLDDTPNSFYGPLAPSTGYIDTFNIIPYHDGMLLLSFDRNHPDQAAEPVPQEKMFAAFEEYSQFNKIIGVENVGQLNEAIRTGNASLLVNVAEALHTKKLSEIAAEIKKRFDRGGARVVLISGPSSSGKTTTAKRLSIQLITCLIKPKVISIDDYFVDREKSPRDAMGNYDFESLYAIDLKTFNDDLNALLRGETVRIPTYNFQTGRREYRDGCEMSLNPDECLLIEGIHGLNPELTRQIPEEQKFKLYVSALTTLSLDNHNWIPTTDNRLLRRIVRDHKYRGSSASDTIARWQSVRAGEEKWIFPYQENADAMFNSSLLFELAVMKSNAIQILSSVPHDVPQYAEAKRLLNFLIPFDQIEEIELSSTSLLREFLGGSIFKY